MSASYQVGEWSCALPCFFVIALRASSHHRIGDLVVLFSYTNAFLEVRRVDDDRVHGDAGEDVVEEVFINAVISRDDHVASRVAAVPMDDDHWTGSTLPDEHMAAN